MQQNNQQTCNTGDKTSCLSFSHGPDDCPRQDVTFVLRRRWVGVKLLAPFIMSAMSFRHRSVYLIYFCSGDIISLLRRGPGSLNPDIASSAIMKPRLGIVWISVPFTLKRFKDLRSKEMFWYRVFGVTLIPLSPTHFAAALPGWQFVPDFLLTNQSKGLRVLPGPCVHYFLWNGEYAASELNRSVFSIT